MNKYNLSQITKVLEKIFKAGFKTKKDILNIKLDDLTKIQDVNGNEIIILLDLKKAIKRGTYHTRTHDSLKISNGKWYWFSRGIGGITAQECLIQVEEYSFTEAVEHLINQKGIEKNIYQK